MHSTIFPPIPLDTAKAALEVYGRNNYYLVIGDQVEDLFNADFFQNPTTRIQGYRLAIFYLTTIFQHFESLPDQLAVDALRMRLDWKYALHASLHPIPMDTSLLCEFRRLVSGDPAIKSTFQTLLDRLTRIPQFAFCNCFTREADQVIHHVCTISRIAKVWEAINNALQALATRNPDWLRRFSLPYWYERYGHSRKHINLHTDLKDLEDFAQSIGNDGFYLLNSVTVAGSRDLAELPEIVALRKIWAEQFDREMEKVVWKQDSCAGCIFTNQAHSAVWDESLSQKGGNKHG